MRVNKRVARVLVPVSLVSAAFFGLSACTDTAPPEKATFEHAPDSSDEVNLPQDSPQDQDYRR